MCPVYLETFRHLEKYVWHEKVFQTELVWYQGGHTISLSIWPCDNVKTYEVETYDVLYYIFQSQSYEGHITIFK